jgi:hypothetical protein
MITAFKEGTRELIFPTRGIKGICPYCEKPLITKCGNINRHHFAHKSTADCDSIKYYDGISDWHIDWQFTVNNPTPGVNIEVPFNNEEYRKRADLLTPAGVIIEFQKSPLPLEERLLRENHYKNMIWVVHKDRLNSKTWKDSVGDKPVFFDLPDALYCQTENFSIKKEKFIRSIINCQFFNQHIWNVIKERGSRRNNNDIIDMYLWLTHDDDDAAENIVGNAIDNDLLEQFHGKSKQFWKEIKLKKRIEERKKRFGGWDPDVGITRFQCPKCNLYWYSHDAFERHKRQCF